jgi:hypothetical protein
MFSTAASEKIKKYEDMRKRHGCSFIPLVFEAFGGFSKGVEDLIKRLKRSDGEGGTGRAQVTNESVIQDMRRKISVAIHRFNAQAMIRGAKASLRAA